MEPKLLPCPFCGSSAEVIGENWIDEFIAAVVPGGDSCDPQIIADAIREYFSAEKQP